MKTTQRGILSIAIIVVALFAAGRVIRAQTDNPLQPVSLTNATDRSAFFKMSDYIANGGSLGGPYPFMPDTNAPMYSLYGDIFLVDDAVVTNDSELADILSLLAQPQDDFSSNLLSGNMISGGAMTMDDVDINPEDYTNSPSGGGGGTNSYTPGVVTYPTNVLWIEVPTNSLAIIGSYSLNLRNTLQEEFYDILTTTNLSDPLTNWTMEQSVYGLEGGITPAQLSLNGRSNLFVTARYAGSSDDSGLPDWWQQRYFGGMGVDPYALDPSGDSWDYLQDYLHGFVPGAFYTPPAVQNVHAKLNPSGNAVVTWQPAPGAATNYTVYRSDSYLGTFVPYSVGLSNQFVDTTFVTNPAAVTPITYYVVANYALGNSPFSTGASPFSTVLNEQLNAQLYLGADGGPELAVSDIPDDADELEVIREDWNPYDFGHGTVSSRTNFFVSVSAFTNGPYAIPTGYVAEGPDGTSWAVQVVHADGSKAQATEAGYLAPFGQYAYSPATFNDASTVLVQNAIFQIRAAGQTGPFEYSYNDNLVPFPTNYVVASLYDTASETLDGVGPYDSFSWTIPFRLNYRYRNFAPNPAGTLNPGVTVFNFAGADDVLLDDPVAYSYPETNTAALPGLLSSSDATWVGPHLVSGAAGLTDSGSQFSLLNNFTNYFGLHLLSVLAVHSNATSGLHADVIDSTHPLSHGSDAYYFYTEFDQPQLQTVGFYFTKTTDDNIGHQPAPGVDNFSPTNLQEYLIFGSPQSSGAPIEVAAFSKQVIVNGNTNKPVYISQYFDKAYAVDTNGNVTSQETGILSPYGTFLPSEPGKVALVTKPDQNGKRGTNIIQIVSFQFDANHDGNMDLSFYSPDSSWRSGNHSAPGPIDFWVNDNFDRHHVVDAVDEDDDDFRFAGLTGLDGNIVPDCDFGVNTPFVGFSPSIPCKKDLEDYARLWIPGLTSMIASLPTNYTVKLDLSGNGKIRLFQAIEPEGGTNYLFDDIVASNQVAQSGALYVGVASWGVLGGSPVILSGRTNLTDYFIMCGAAAGDAQLHLYVQDQNGQNVMDTMIYFNLKEVTDMYERWTVGERPDYDPTNTPQLAVDGFPDWWNNAPFHYNQSADTNMPYILFVHGWNMAPWEKDRFADSAFKRLYWLGYKGRFGLFRWPTGYNFNATYVDLAFDRRNYDNSEFNAWKSGAGLENLLEQLNTQYPSHVYMLAHSMGNVVAGEALRLAGTNQIVNTYVASQAAVPAHTYDSTVTNTIFPLLPPVTPNIYNDWFAGNNGAADRRINFYNTNDYALQSGHWELDQRLKPDVGVFITAYQFSGVPYTNFDGRYTPGSADDSYPWNYFIKNTPLSGITTFDLAGALTNRYEVSAYAAQARSTALGRTPDVLDRGVDLSRTTSPLWPLDPSGNAYGDHKWHSAEFRSNLMEQQNYWRTLLYTADGFNLPTP